MRTSKQAKDLLLCKDCEGRFNLQGETWVLKNRWLGETEFPLQAALRAVKPVWIRSGFSIYEGAATPGVDVDALVYFGASVFWRGGVNDWRIGDLEPVRLDLGPYEEELRRFLLEAQSFPADMVLTVTVSGSTKVLHNEFVMFPFLKDRKAAFRQYKFVIPGITFQMFTGKGIPVSVRALCTVRSPTHFVQLASTMDEMNLNDAWALVSKGKPVGSLK